MSALKGGGFDPSQGRVDISPSNTDQHMQCCNNRPFTVVYFKKRTKKSGFSSHKSCSSAFFPITDDTDVQAALIVNHNLGWKPLCRGCFPCKCHFKQLRLLFQGASPYATRERERNATG